MIIAHLQRRNVR